MLMLMMAMAAAAVLLVDQGLKAWIVRTLAPGGVRALFGPLHLVHRPNPRGVAFGGRSRGPRAAGPAHRQLLIQWLLVGAALALVLQSAPHAPWAPGPWQLLGAAWALGAALGGAASNLLDLARRGAVIDLLPLGRWRCINLADAAIVAGAAGGAVALLGAWAADLVARVAKA